MVAQALVLLTAAIIAVPLAKRAGLSAVLGYLIAGVLIGPSALGIIAHIEATRHLAEYGVVFLLFLIGLELNPTRLWVMRRAVFGLGLAQVALSAIPIGLIAWLLTKLSWNGALVVGIGLALSSTAFVMPVLAEKRDLQTPYGQAAFSILLFQDLAVIPLLAVLPMLGGQHPTHVSSSAQWVSIAKVAAVLLGLVVASRYLIRPLFRLISSSGSNEILTAAALALVVGTAGLLEAVGLSASLGAFLAGVLLADSEYRHELQADIEPFKGLLLGLFFMTVGMGTNLNLLGAAPLVLLSGAFAFMLIKVGVTYLIALRAGQTPDGARHLAFAIPQGGEFAFVLFGLAAGYNLMSEAYADGLVVIVTLSMVFSPLFTLFDDLVLTPRFAAKNTDVRPFDAIDVGDNQVIIAGLGRFGQIIARILRLRKIAFTALDADAEHVEALRKFGNKLFFGDASRLDLLRSAHAEHARIFVLAIDDVEASVRTAEIVKHHFPNLEIFARARNRDHAYQLMALGVNIVVRETFHSALRMSERVLQALGDSAEAATETAAKFAAYDETMVQTNFVHRDNEDKLIQSAQEASRELESLFANDNVAAPAVEAD